MKKILCALTLVGVLVCVLSSCDFLNQFGETSPEIFGDFFDASQGLAYGVNGDGETCTIRGIGTCIDSDIYIGGYIDGYKITNIDSRAFYYCTDNLTSVTIGDSVTSIGEEAFRGCANLTNVTILGSLTTVGANAFSDCNTSLYEEYNYGKYVGNSTNPYEILVQLTNTKFSVYAIHPDTKVLGGGVFQNCKNLTSIVIPNNVSTIGMAAFENCSKLTSVIIPDSVTIIDNNAFYDCSALMDVIMGNSVISIGAYAFAQCPSLTSVTIPGSVTCIGDGAFSRCYNLTSIKIPASVSTIGNYPFFNCSNLANIIVDKNNTTYKSIDGNLYSKDGTVLIAYAMGKTDTSFVIPDSVTTIGNYAFKYCSNLTSVTVGDSVTSIGVQAFDCCNNLKNVIFANPHGWWCADDANTTSATVLTSYSLSSTSVAAYYLESLYRDYFWFRAE